METILAAVDGSQYTWVVARYAADLALIADARVLAAYVVDAGLVAGPLADLLATELAVGDRKEITRRLAEALRRHGDASLAVAQTIFTQHNVRTDAVVEQGRPAEVLAAMAPLYDLAVIGSVGWNAQFGARPIGATANELLRLATRPVMLVRGEYRPVRHVLIGYDGSPEAFRGLSCAASLARAGSWQVTIATAGAGKSREDQLRAQIEKLVGFAEIPCEITFARGRPDQTLLDMAAALPADLIVVGSRGTSRRGRRILGSTTEILSRYAPVPLLIYR